MSGVSNAVINGLIAWLLLRNNGPLTWTGDQNIAVDIVATSLLLPFFMALIIIPLQRARLRKGLQASIDLGEHSALQRFANRFPTSIFGCAALFAMLGLVVIAPSALLGFYLLGVQQITAIDYTIFKAVWAGFIAAILVLLMVLIALKPNDLSTQKTT